MSNSIHQNFQLSTPFLRGYKQLIIPIINTDGIPAWPELFPTEKIDELREMVGPRHFSSQMMLEYISESKARLDPGALHFYSDEFDPRSAKLGEKNITGYSCYWDPSLGRARSDGSVCVIIYRDDKNRFIFIHDIKYLRVNDNEEHPLTSQCDSVLNFMNLHNKKVLTIETNGMGVGLPEIMAPMIKSRGQDIRIQKVVNSKSKETKILESMEPILNTGRLYVHERIRYTPFLAEMLGWSPIGSNQIDDGLDAVSGALRINAIPIRSISAQIQNLHAKTDFKV